MTEVVELTEGQREREAERERDCVNVWFFTALLSSYILSDMHHIVSLPNFRNTI